MVFSRLIPWTLLLIVVFTSALLAGTAGRKLVQPLPALPDVDTILDRYVKELGGKEAIQNVTSIYAAGTIGSHTARFLGASVMYWQAPDKFLKRLTVPGAGVIEYGYDGKVGWRKDPKAGLRQLQGEELAQYLRHSDTIHRAIRLKQIYRSMRVTKKEKVDGSDAYVIEALLPNGKPEKLYFDISTGLLVRQDLVSISPDGEVQTQIFFEDYKDIGGVKVPFTLRQVTESLTVVTKQTEVKLNVPIDEGKFAEPSESSSADPSDGDPVTPKPVIPDSHHQIGRLSEEELERKDAQGLAALPLIEQARRKILSFKADIPNFVVNQTLTRYEHSSGDRGWKPVDTFDMELTYQVGKGEHYKVLRHNGKPTDKEYEQFKGFTSMGELSENLTGLFEPETDAKFTEVKHENFHGRDTVIYDFSVVLSNSKLEIDDGISKQKIITAYSGRVWVDTESKQVLRLEYATDGIPDWFPISRAEDAVEYDWVKIDDDKYLLPVHAEVLLETRKRGYGHNVIEFTNYRKFEGIIKIEPGL